MKVRRVSNEEIIMRPKRVESKFDRKIIGYWGSSKKDSTWPWPQDCVDEEQTETMINTIANYLDGGKFFEGYLGWSNCRICGCVNGSTELSDGVYIWPEGLSHYVREHKVRLPDEFIQHVIDKLEDEGKK